MISTEQVYELSKRWQIDQVSIIREYVQLVFLSKIYSMRGSEDLFFKGGTAIRFLANSFRFSEDLDFTSLLSPSKLKKLLKDAVKASRGEIVNCAMDKLEIKRNSITTRLWHKADIVDQTLNVHLEISTREKPLTRVSSPIETLFPISPYPIVTHLSVEEIMAEKIRALVKRAKGRDIFDLWFLMSKEVPLKWEMVEKKMKFYKESMESGKLLKKIINMDEKKIFHDLNKFLPKNYRPLIKDLKSKTLSYLEKQL